MTDPQDEAIGKLSRAVVALSVAVLILLGLILLASFTSERETQHFQEVRNIVVVEDNSHNPSTIPNTEMHGITIEVSRGYQLFKDNCSSCHRVEGRVCGEGLKRVFERIPNEKWFMNFIADSDSLVNSGDPYALKLHTEWRSGVVHQFNYLTEEEVINIAAYIISNS